MEETKGKIIQFKKLKVLSISLRALPERLLYRFDWTSCSDSLRHLYLRLTYSPPNDPTKEFLSLIKFLRNLESLVLIDGEGAVSALNVIKHLNNLRYDSLIVC